MTSLPTQKQMVLKHLLSLDPVTKDTRGLTHYQAEGLYRCTRLAARIEELRDDGHKIVSIKKKDLTGKEYVKYYSSRNQHCYLEGSVQSLPRNRK
jgi:hypothetical protein